MPSSMSTPERTHVFPIEGNRKSVLLATEWYLGSGWGRSRQNEHDATAIMYRAYATFSVVRICEQPMSGSARRGFCGTAVAAGRADRPDSWGRAAAHLRREPVINDQQCTAQSTSGSESQRPSNARRTRCPATAHRPVPGAGSVPSTRSSVPPLRTEATAQSPTWPRATSPLSTSCRVLLQRFRRAHPYRRGGCRRGTLSG